MKRLMRKKYLIYIFIGLFLLPVMVFAQNLLNYPQKIVIDSDHDRLLVSNYGDGSLVEIDPEGNQDYFDQYAGFIDGMDIVGNIVYGVGSDRRLIGYDLDLEEQVLEFSFPGDADDYLSSVTSDSSGCLFISCPALHTIYRFRLSDQSYWVFAQDNGLNRPNGIFLERDNDMIVVIDDSPGQSAIHAISLSDSTVTTLLETDLDRPDGIVRARTGEYYIGGFYLPGLYRVEPDFSQPPELYSLGSYMVYPTYDPADHSILITRYMDDSWERFLLPGGTLLGTVSTLPYVQPDEVEIQVDIMSIHPDPSGIFAVRLPLGIYDIKASLDGYETITWVNAEILDEQITSVYFTLSFIQAPVDLEAELNENTVTLSWQHTPPAERIFQTFNIYRNINGGEFGLYTSTEDQTFQELIEPGAEYGYYVTALYEQENESDPSNIVYVDWNEANDIIVQNQNILFQNYPNPFNPETTFFFRLITENTVNTELIIYNSTGQKVRSFDFRPGYNKGLENQSDYSITWNGTDSNNHPVPSGVYFYKLKSGEFEQTRKMLLIK